jgi:hypothetical protein
LWHIRLFFAYTLSYEKLRGRKASGLAKIGAVDHHRDSADCCYPHRQMVSEIIQTETIRHWLSDYIATRPRLVRFLAAAVHLSGEPPKTKRYISLEVVAPMLSRDELEARINELLHSGLNEQETELVGMVEAAKRRGPLGPGIDPFDDDSDE